MLRKPPRLAERTRPFRGGVVAVVGLLLALPGCGYSAEYEVENREPVSYSLTGDPRVIVVSVRWESDGYCAGQLRPVVREEDDRVVVDTVENWVYEGDEGACAGVGVGAAGLAGGSAELQATLGSRDVVRASDQRVLERMS